MTGNPMDELGVTLIEQLEPLLATAAGLKAKVIESGMEPETAEAVAREYLVGLIRMALTPKPKSFLDTLRDRT